MGMPGEGLAGNGRNQKGQIIRLPSRPLKPSLTPPSHLPTCSGDHRAEAGREDELHPTGQGRAALPGPHAQGGHVEGHQGGAAGGVDGEAGAPQAEGEAQTAGGDGDGGACEAR